MMQSFVERELKFDVDPGFVVPPLDKVVTPGGRVETASEHLRSDYFDTADHALLRAKITLRRRTGSTDVGWQLKIPHAPFREEIHAAVHDGAVEENVPEELANLLLGVSGGQSLKQIASVVTEREVTRLLDEQGAPLVEIDDDTVHASAGSDAGAVVSTWREVEIELGDASGDRTDLLDTLSKRLRRAGARKSASASKLSRALPETVTSELAATTATTRRSKLTAGAVITAYVAEQHRVLLVGDLALRRGDDSVIHKTRVATRRLRSTLRVFGALVQADRAAALDTELRWLAAELGEVRDRHVLQQRLDLMIDAVDDALLLGPVRSRVDNELQSELADRWQRLQRDLSSDRYLALLADLGSWVRQPPLTAKADRPAGDIKALVAKADKHVDRKLREANRSGDVHLLHAARKAAKRARYAAEAAEPVVGTHRSARDAKLYQQLQDLLGEHQDSMVSAEFLRRLGASAGTTGGENGFAFGILHEREQQTARETRRRARKIAKRYA